MKLEHFTPHLYTRFRLETANGSIELELIQAEKLKTSGLRDDPFFIVFRGPREMRLPQRIYRLHHDQLDTLDIFLIPGGVDEHGMLYEAVWN